MATGILYTQDRRPTLLMSYNVQTTALVYPREMNSISIEVVKQVVRRNGRRCWKERGEASGVEGNCPPGSRDSSNNSCSSVRPTTSWGVTERQREETRGEHAEQFNEFETTCLHFLCTVFCEMTSCVSSL